MCSFLCLFLADSDCCKRGCALSIAAAASAAALAWVEPHDRGSGCAGVSRPKHELASCPVQSKPSSAPTASVAAADAACELLLPALHSLLLHCAAFRGLAPSAVKAPSGDLPGKSSPATASAAPLLLAMLLLCWPSSAATRSTRGCSMGKDNCCCRLPPCLGSVDPVDCIAGRREDSCDLPG